MNEAGSMPVVGLAVIILIIMLFALSVVLLFYLYLRYRSLAEKASAEPNKPGSFCYALLTEYSNAYRKYGQDVNTPAIITETIGNRLSGLLLCERFLNNAVSLFVTLGLFGTFLGLSLSVSSLTELIGYSNTSDWLSVMDSVGGGLLSALGGMGVAFYTSLAGAGCSIAITVLRTILSPQAERERLETRLELWLDMEVAPELNTDAARGEAGMVRQMIRVLNNTATDIREALFQAADAYSASARATGEAMGKQLERSKEVIQKFNGAIDRFDGGIHSFTEVDYNLRGSVERMDLAVRDLSNAFREISRRMDGGKR